MRKLMLRQKLKETIIRHGGKKKEKDKIEVLFSNLPSANDNLPGNSTPTHES